MVKIVIDNVYSRILGQIPDDVDKILFDTLAYKLQGAQHIEKVKKGYWDGIIRLYMRHQGQQFYTGLLGIVREIFDAHNIDHIRIDQRTRPDQNMPNLMFLPPPRYEERDYQTFTIDRSKKFTRGILSVSTGGGKTLILARLISEIKTAPFIFYVLTKDLMEQGHDVLSTCLNTEIGKIGDGICDIKPITVCTIQTAIRALNWKNKEFKISDYKFDDEDSWKEKDIANEEKARNITNLIRSSKGLFLDEAHHAGARTIQDVANASKNAYWRFGGTATPYRDSGDEILIQAMFGSKIVHISASYLIKRKILLPPHIIFYPIEGKSKYSSYAKVYKECVSSNDDFNIQVANQANHLISRGLSVLILVKHYPQGEFIKKYIPNTEFVTGKMTTKKRTESINDLRSRKKMCMIATTLADEGLDIPNLNAVLIAGGGASSTRMIQRVGRTIRIGHDQDAIMKDKSIVIVYDHYKTKYLKDHTKKVRKIFKEEPEFKILESNGENDILDELDEIIGLKTHSPSLFDV